MEASNPIPWYNRPARPYPIHLWMMQRYGFILPPLRFARQAAPVWRPFPARLWMEGRERRE